MIVNDISLVASFSNCYNLHVVFRMTIFLYSMTVFLHSTIITNKLISRTTISIELSLVFIILNRKVLKEWHNTVQEELREKRAMADELNHYLIVKRSFTCWKKV